MRKNKQIIKKNNKIRKSNPKVRKENEKDFRFLPTVDSNKMKEPICLECFDRNHNYLKEEREIIINED